jgi:hypothetical protein
MLHLGVFQNEAWVAESRHSAPSQRKVKWRRFL